MYKYYRFKTSPLIAASLVCSSSKLWALLISSLARIGSKQKCNRHKNSVQYMYIYSSI